MKRFLFLPLLVLPIAAFAEGGLPDDPHHYRFLPVTVTQNVHVIYLISPAK